jgi:sugar phosphate permease
MTSALARLLGRHGIHYGWLVAGITFLIMLVTSAAVGAPGVFMVPLEREYGWAPADVASAQAVRFLLFGLMGPFAAALLNRFGLRRMVAISFSTIVAALAASLFMTRLWQLVALWGVAVGLGTGLTATVLGATVALRWFSARRGLIVGLLSASTATGQLVFLPLTARLTESFGWRRAVEFLCVMLLVTAALALSVLRDRPADLGLPPCGEREIAPPPPERTGLLALLRGPLAVLRESARTRVFWVLFASFLICGASTNGLVQTHFIALCGDYGLSAVTAAGILAMMGVFDFVGTVGSGWLSDRFDNRWLLGWYYALRGLSLLFLPLATFSLPGLAPFAVFYGLDWIATVPPTVRLTAARFGPERSNVVFGWIFAGHQMGAAMAAYGAGLARTLSASYLPAFFAAGALCIVASALVLTLPMPVARRPSAAV